MIRRYFLITFCLPFFICCMNDSPKESNFEKSCSAATTYQPFNYPSLPFPDFLNQLFKNHFKSIQKAEERNYQDFIQTHDLKDDSLNNFVYLKLKFYHTLFTSATAANCSQSGILKIPYFWHWVSPNPRHQLRFRKDSTLLKNTAPPAKFARYKCYADIDRTPDIFLGDLLSNDPAYISPGCGSFYTFGWCSEREMSFVLLMEQNNYTAKVISSSNHTWSEVLVTFNGKAGKTDFIFQIDNTFDIFKAAPINQTDKTSWLNKTFTGKLPKWYNDMAHSATQKKAVAQLIAGTEASQRIDKDVFDYYH